MSDHAQIGERVRAALGERSQSWLASQVEMPRDSMSRSLNGLRGFSSVELARIADVLGADVREFITGEPDPHRLVVAARHTWDPITRERANAGRDEDETTLQAISLAYRQAYPHGAPRAPDVPSTPGEVAEALGDQFVRQFLDRLEERLGIDVIRLPSISTAYSVTAAGRGVVVLPSTGNWWKSNFDLAHEVAHLALGHLATPSRDVDQAHELAANAFASELLMPEARIRQIEWSTISRRDVAQFLWDTGVGTSALANRLQSLGVEVSADVVPMLAAPMPGAMRSVQGEMDLPRPSGSTQFEEAFDAFDARMQDAARRRFPVTLVAIHRRRIEEDGVSPGTLAWMLDTPVDDLVQVSAALDGAFDVEELFGA